MSDDKDATLDGWAFPNVGVSCISMKVVTVWKDEMGLNPSNTWTAIVPWQFVTKALIKQSFCLWRLSGGNCLMSSVFPAASPWRGRMLPLLPGELHPADVGSAVQWWWNLAHFDPMWNDRNIWAAALQPPLLFPHLYAAGISPDLTEALFCLPQMPAWQASSGCFQPKVRATAATPEPPEPADNDERNLESRSSEQLLRNRKSDISVDQCWRWETSVVWP